MATEASSSTTPSESTTQAPAKRQSDRANQRSRSRTPSKSKARATTQPKAKAKATTQSAASKEDVGTDSKHDKRVGQLVTAVRKATKLPVTLANSTMENRLVLKVGGATAAWLWLSRGQLNAFSSRTGLDIKGVGVGTWTMAKSAKEIVDRAAKSPGRGQAAPARKTRARSANGGQALQRDLKATLRKATGGRKTSPRKK